MVANVSVSVVLDNDHYYGGDVLTGTVHVAVVEPVQCKHVRLTFSGKELVRWRESVERDGSRTTVERENEHETISTSVVLADIDGEIQPGAHSYRFTIELPENLPGQFMFTNYHDGSFAQTAANYNASVNYEIQAVITSSDPDSRRRVPPIQQVVNIFQRPPSQKLKPSHDSGRRQVYFLCCIKRGTCKLTATLDQATYFPGDTAIVHVQIKNDSQVDVTSLRCRVVQEVAFVKSEHSTSRITQIVALTELAGIPVGKTANYDEEIVLVTKEATLFPPSMQSTLVECSYRLELECNVPWCPDFELHLPLTLVAPNAPRGSGVIVHGTAFPEVA